MLRFLGKLSCNHPIFPLLSGVICLLRLAGKVPQPVRCGVPFFHARLSQHKIFGEKLNDPRSFAHMEKFSEEHEMPSSKRAKFMVQEASAVSIDNSLSATNENSPLGLKLRKSPSLLDLAQLSLSCLKSQENLGYVHTVRSIQEAGEMENRRCAVVATNSKKATNFSASIPRLFLDK